MKNKKGFTLVELLAVIAILAILVIIALPNVMKMYNDARQGTFDSEAKSIYKIAQQTFLSRMETTEKIYSNISGSSDSLDIQAGNSTYCIKLNSSGKVVQYVVTNSTNSYQELGGSEIKIENVKANNGSNAAIAKDKVAIDTTTGCKVNN